MIIGVGVDIVDVNRMRHWWERPKLLRRFFHENEIEAVKKRKSAEILSLAARFAAKEAFGKALGTGMRSLTLSDIEVRNSHNGKPEIRLHGSAQRAMETAGGLRLHISMTHEKNHAVAMVVIEGE